MSFGERYTAATETRGETATRHAWAGRIIEPAKNERDLATTAKQIGFAVTTIVTATVAAAVIGFAAHAITVEFNTINAALSAALQS